VAEQLRVIGSGSKAPAARAPLAALKQPTRFLRRRVMLAGATTVLVAAVGVPRLWESTSDPVASPPPHLVALPCEAAAGDDAAHALCDGITDVILAKLARLTASHALQVTPQIGGVRRDVRTIDDARRGLGATRVLRVAARPDAGGLRLEYTLADPRLPSPLDAQTLTIDDGSVFDGQDRIVAWLVRAMALDLTHPEREVLVAHPTSSPEAQLAYLRARGYLAGRPGPSPVDDALASFNAAVAQDGTFASAHAGLGLASWAKNRDRPDADLKLKGRESCEHAVDLQPTLADAHLCLGLMLQSDGDDEAAAMSLERAIELNPALDDAHVSLGRLQERRSSADAERVYLRAVKQRPYYWAAHTWLGSFYGRQGRYEDMAGAYERAIALVPDNRRGRATLGVPSMLLGRYDDAIAAFKEAVAIEPTREAYVNWGMTLFRMRRFDEAVALIQRARELGRADHLVLGNLARAYYWSGKPGTHGKAESLYAEAIALAEQELQKPSSAVPKPDLHMALAEYYAKTGRAAESRTHLKQVGLSESDKVRPTDPHQLFYAALVYSQLGDRDAAIAWLERAVYWGVPAAELRAWIELDAVRNDPAFQKLVRAH
jgi:tetratricopeptide (TPR) repeat protein/TolB-like protein